MGGVLGNFEEAIANHLSFHWVERVSDLEHLLPTAILFGINTAGAEIANIQLNLDTQTRCSKP